MITVLSPAKSLDFETPLPTEQYSTADFLDQSDKLIEKCRKLDAQALKDLMHISDKLAELNVQRFADYEQPLAPGPQSRPAALAFTGDTYVGFDARTLSEDELRWSQEHVRILSGLYGLLRPMDLIRPYRLEMGSRLENSRGKNLYAFWGNRLSNAIDEALQGAEHAVVINCASKEYFSAMDTKALKARVVTPVFKDFKNGQYKVISFFAKRARGAMARHIVSNRITDPADIVSFDYGHYAHDPEQSTPDAPVFTRNVE